MIALGGCSSEGGTPTKEATAGHYDALSDEFYKPKIESQPTDVPEVGYWFISKEFIDSRDSIVKAIRSGDAIEANRLLEQLDVPRPAYFNGVYTSSGEQEAYQLLAWMVADAIFDQGLLAVETGELDAAQAIQGQLSEHDGNTHQDHELRAAIGEGLYNQGVAAVEAGELDIAQESQRALGEYNEGSDTEFKAKAKDLQDMIDQLLFDEAVSSTEG